MVFGELPGWWTHPHTGEVMHPDSMGTEVPVFRTLPDLTLWISSSVYSSVFFIISFNKLVNISVSLVSVSPSSKLIKPQEVVVGTTDLKSSRTDVVGDLRTSSLQLASAARREQSWGTEPLTCGIWHYLHVDGVKDTHRWSLSNSGIKSPEAY